MLTRLSAIDSVEDTGNSWVRSAGFDEAWTKWVKRMYHSFRSLISMYLGSKTAREHNYENGATTIYD